MRVRTLGACLVLVAAAMAWAASAGRIDEGPQTQGRNNGDHGIPDANEVPQVPRVRDVVDDPAGAVTSLFVPPSVTSPSTPAGAGVTPTSSAVTAAATTPVAPAGTTAAERDLTAPAAAHNLVDASGSIPESAGYVAVAGRDPRREVVGDTPAEPAAERGADSTGDGANRRLYPPRRDTGNAEVLIPAAPATADHNSPKPGTSLSSVAVGSGTSGSGLAGASDTVTEPTHGMQGRLEVVAELARPDGRREYYLVDRTTGALLRLGLAEPADPQSPAAAEAGPTDGATYGTDRREVWSLRRGENGSLIVDHVGDEGWIRYTVPFKMEVGL